jgi:hypothetical protein
VVRLALRPRDTDEVEFALLWADLDRQLPQTKSSHELATGGCITLPTFLCVFRAMVNGVSTGW